MGKVPRLLMGRYEPGKVLGKGSFAKVYHARNVASGEEVAIKIMDKDHLAKSGAVQQQVTREIENMRRVRHPRIHEVMATKKSIFVVMEFVGGGSLDACLIRHAGRGVGEACARRVFQQLVSALEYCHSLGVYHRDIKPDNILIDDTGSIKVADFGLSALVGMAQQEMLLHTVCGTPMYIAPEVLLRRGYDGAKVRCNYNCPSWFSAGLVRLVRGLLCPDPARRITIPQNKETPWFKKGFKEIPQSLGEPEQREWSPGRDDWSRGGANGARGGANRARGSPNRGLVAANRAPAAEGASPTAGAPPLLAPCAGAGDGSGRHSGGGAGGQCGKGATGGGGASSGAASVEERTRSRGAA